MSYFIITPSFKKSFLKSLFLFVEIFAIEETADAGDGYDNGGRNAEEPDEQGRGNWNPDILP